ncbi:MAG: hypothetical protein J2P57_08140, partial [Acidimicrobiaceae bacterium]|nr:hypothetical protein [Acidimicrobiaceae bacterium]
MALMFGLFTALTVIAPSAGATPVPPSTSSCTYNGSASVVTGVSPGGAITVSCTGLPASTSVALAEASPLGGVVDPPTAASSEADVAGVVLATTDASGALTATFNVPATFSAGDPNAACPPTQAQVNAGLVTCALAIASVATQTPLNEALLVYNNQPTPAAPTLAVTPSAGLSGDTLTAKDASGATSFWYGNALAPVTGLTATVGGVTATNTLSVSAAVYCFTGHTSAACSSATSNVVIPPKLSGSITVPSGVTAGSAPVVVDEPNSTPFTGAVQATAPFTVLGAPAITVAPTSGGPGVNVAVSGSGWDPQGGPVSLTFASGTPASTGTGTVSASGSLTGSIAVTTSDTVGSNSITATQTAANGSTLTATAAFTVTSVSAGPCATSGSPLTCQIGQVISESVQGDPTGLIISEANNTAACPSNTSATSVTLTPITLNGKAQQAGGCLNTVTVEDARGTLVGWNTTGQLETDFLGPNVGANVWDHVIPAQNLTWTPGVSLTFPSAPNGPSGVLSEVNAGAQGGLPTAL